MCGEKSVTYTLLERCGGSPPHMRGKDHGRGRRGRKGRITPAYAGKSHCVTSCWPFVWDHPRVCGEKKSSTARVLLF